jgi:chromosome partitioning protein
MRRHSSTSIHKGTSNGVGLEAEYTAESTTLYDVLQSPTEYELPTLAVSHREFDVVPANIDMFSLDQELVSAMQGRLRLQMLLDTGVDGCD